MTTTFPPDFMWAAAFLDADFASAVPCRGFGRCDSPAELMVLADCAGCGRFHRPVCPDHGKLIRRHVGGFTHRPCDLAVVTVVDVRPL